MNDQEKKNQTERNLPEIHIVCITLCEKEKEEEKEENKDENQNQ